MLKASSFPKDMSVFDVNHQQPRRCLVSGLFEETVETEGCSRTFYTYLAPGLVYNRPCIIIAPPDHVPVLEYLENSFWLDFAHKNQIFLHILIPENGGWKQDGTDGDYMNQVYIQVNSRRAYVVMQDNIYAVGIGNGSSIAHQAVMKMSSEWSGLATFGDLKDSALLNREITSAPVRTGKTELTISASKVQVPVWVAWSEHTGINAQVCQYWKTINDSQSEPYSNQWADEIYVPNPICKKSQINEEKIAQIRITNGFDGALTEKFFAEVWDWMKQFCRHRSFGTKMLRRRIEPSQYGFSSHSMELDGFTRSWFEYVPCQVQKSSKAVPLVVCMHGRGGTAESFISLSGMSRVAEERNFIAVFPEACVSQQRPDGLRNLLLWNGCYREQPIDDTAFILQIIEQVKKRYPVDPTRIYACGQSSGGMMTSTLAIRAPRVFAAVAPWSALVSPDHELQLPQTITPAVPYFFLFGENDWLCSDPEHGELEYHPSKQIAAFLKNLIRLYHLNETPLSYRCGEIHYFVYLNSQNVPMLTVGTVENMSHANYPGESWASYDQFFAKFSKLEDGTLLYMGQPAV